MNPGRLRHIALVGLLVLLAGCATTSLAPNTVSRIKKVGVISLTAYEFQRLYMGLTVFGNQKEKQDISAWKIDDEYELQMQDALSKLGLFEAVRVPYEREVFYKGGKVPHILNMEEELKAFARNNSLDTVVVVIRSYDKERPETPWRKEGAGFFVDGIGTWTGTSVIHLLSSVVVIDGQTGKPMATKDLVFTKNVPAELARAKLADLDKTKMEVRTMLIDLPKRGWEPQFRKIFMSGTN